MVNRIIAVSGEKNSGKTTLISRLLPLLTEKGLNVAVIKHDGHSFSPDVPGTDTHAFMQAGAVGAAVYDGEKFMLTRKVSVCADFLISQFPDADLIIIEGLKNSSLPKLMLKDGMAYSSFSGDIFDRDDVEKIAGFISAWVKGGTGNA